MCEAIYHAYVLGSPSTVMCLEAGLLSSIADKVGSFSTCDCVKCSQNDGWKLQMCASITTLRRKLCRWDQCEINLKPVEELPSLKSS